MNIFNAMKVQSGSTANGAVTNTSSLNACLDLFFIAWASRNMPVQNIEKMFSMAYYSDKTRALKIMFWARDCRGGAGEKRFFNICWNWLLQNHPEDYNRLATHVPTFGKWKDLFVHFNNTVASLVREGLENQDSLLAKWLPRKGDFAGKITKFLSLSPKQYRKKIVALTNVVETQMCNREWSWINYSSVPSIAFNNYRKAFARHDEARFNSFIQDVNEWKWTLNASVLFPYQVWDNYIKWDDRNLITAQWSALKDYTGEWNVLPIIDTSWSMSLAYGKIRPISISISLGVYLSEKIKGKFHNKIISFEGKPRLHEFSDEQSVVDKFNYVSRMGSDCSTNLAWVFDLLLDSAVRMNVPSEEMPSTLLIISDMEFNSTWPTTNFEYIKNKYMQAWYELPYIIFWNVNGREDNVPALQSDYVGLVSWASPSLIPSVCSGNLATPQELMDKVIMAERYNVIS